MSSPPNNGPIEANALFNVTGLVALITGGGTGIGLMMAKALANNGAAKVYIAGRRLNVLQAAAASAGSSVIPVKCDVTCKTSLEEAVAFIERDAGCLNLLVCNSGIGGPSVKPLTPETTLEEWASTNLAVDYDDMAFLKLLDAGNKKRNMEQTSQIIVTSSIAALNKKAPGGWAYGQSKAATLLAAKQLAVALPQWNIRANCIAPGLFPSEMSEPIVRQYGGEGGASSGGVTNTSENAQIRVPAAMVPMQRMGDEKEMAGTLLYLASRAGAYNNGAVIVVDGGRLGTFPAVF